MTLTVETRKCQHEWREGNPAYQITHPWERYWWCAKCEAEVYEWLA